MIKERDDLLELNLSFLQMDVALGDREANEKKISELVKALPEHCDFLVLPELWNIGYDGDHIEEKAETMKGPSIAFLRQLAREHRVNIIGGSIAEKHENGIFNTLPVINREGDCIYKYRKVHLFPLEINEPDLFQAGDDWGICTHEQLTFGTMICYDLRFPAFCRNLALRGASVVFVPAQWPAARLNHFRLLLQARAVENQIYVIGVNRTGGKKIRYQGGSLVVAPDGSLVLDADEKEGLYHCTIYPEQSRSIREMIPVFRDRRNILDEIDDNLF